MSSALISVLPLMLELRNVTAGYGPSLVLREVSLAVRAGAVTTLVGANGAGKTTTLRAIVNQVRTSSGEIMLDGTTIRGLRTDVITTNGIALVPEGRRIFEGLTVLENLRVGGFKYSSRAEVSARIEDALQLFPRLRERSRQLGSSLSGGEQQMLAIGRALMSNPKLLLLDEPSMGLAPKIVEQVFSVIRTLRERGTTILLIEQNAHHALNIADDAYVMESGSIVLKGRGSDLLNDARVIETYLGG
jgi:branched-chain amino acid transport system ATP-binding protein